MLLHRLSYRTILTGLVLALSVGAEAYVLYFIDEPWSRVGIGLLLLAVIMWASARLGLAERLRGAVTRQFKIRRFLRLRGLIDELITCARLLNGLKVDIERGVKRGDPARTELERLEKRLDELVDQVKDAAGKADQD